jgi:phosphoribosylanthranilate isomerase
MKQKDIPLLVVIIAISAMFSYFISGQIFSAPSKRQLQVEQVNKITPEFPKLTNGNLEGDLSKYINKDSNNPTSIIRIGDTGNPTPIKN